LMFWAAAAAARIAPYAASHWWKPGQSCSIALEGFYLLGAVSMQMKMKTVSRCWQVARCFNRPPLSPTPQNLRHRQTDGRT
jgi:hypothetical protein